MSVPANSSTPPNQSNNSSWRNWGLNIAYNTLSNATSYATSSLTPIVNTVISTIPQPIANSFKATMQYTGVWQRPCSEAITEQQYLYALLIDGQKPPSYNVDIIIPSSLRQNNDIAKQVEDSLKLAGLSQTLIDKNKEQIGKYFQAASDIIFLEFRNRYENDPLNFSPMPRGESLPLLRIKLSDRKDSVTLDVEWFCELQNLNIRSMTQSKKWEPLATVKALVSGSVDLIGSNSPRSINHVPASNTWKITLSPKIIGKPQLVIKDYVKKYPIEKNLRDLTIPSLDVPLQIPFQLEQDFNRSAYFVGEELRTSSHFVDEEKSSKKLHSSTLAELCEAIYLLTDKDKEKTEFVCQFICQTVTADSTEIVYDKFKQDNSTPTQVPGDPPKYHIFKDQGDIKLLATVIFRPKDLSEDAEQNLYNGIKTVTLINFTTGHAVIDCNC